MEKKKNKTRYSLTILLLLLLFSGIIHGNSINVKNDSLFIQIKGYFSKKDIYRITYTINGKTVAKEFGYNKPTLTFTYKIDSTSFSKSFDYSVEKDSLLLKEGSSYKMRIEKYSKISKSWSKVKIHFVRIENCNHIFIYYFQQESKKSASFQVYTLDKNTPIYTYD